MGDAWEPPSEATADTATTNEETQSTMPVYDDSQREDNREERARRSLKVPDFAELGPLELRAAEIIDAARHGFRSPLADHIDDVEAGAAAIAYTRIDAFIASVKAMAKVAEEARVKLGERYDPALTDYVYRTRSDSRKKSLDIAGVRVQLRARKDSLIIHDVAEAINWAAEHCPEAVNYSPRVNKGPLAEHAATTGEIPQGCGWISARPDSVSVRAVKARASKDGSDEDE